MARYSMADLKTEFDNSAGSLQDMSQYLLEVDGIDREALVEESTGVGDSDEVQRKVGVNKVGPITLRGQYDDTASTGPDVIFNSIGDTRTLKVTLGGTKTFEVETIIKNYKRNPTRGELTKFEVMLQPTGAVTEA